MTKDGFGGKSYTCVEWEGVSEVIYDFPEFFTQIFLETLPLGGPYFDPNCFQLLLCHQLRHFVIYGG